MNVQNNCKALRIFAHVGYGFSAKTWNMLYNNGSLLGVNEPYAYGYHRAREYGCQVTYSEDHPETRTGKLFRHCVRYCLKFDFVHAWRNRDRIRGADVVWTHTESQHLAILLLFWLTRTKSPPKLIAQSVWLFDRWRDFSPINRWLIKRLLSQADLLTVLSPENLKIARQLFPNVRSELVLYGIRADRPVEPRLRAISRPIRLISIGNDEHRDWKTLIDAVKNREGCELRIASRKVNPKLIADAANIAVVRVKTNTELMELYDWADVLVVALKPNFHASGITVLQEAALRGIPTICTDVGGLRVYFSDEALKYVAPQNCEAIWGAISELAANDQARFDLAKRAQAQMSAHRLSSDSFVRRHVELSRELLFDSSPQPKWRANLIPALEAAFQTEGPPLGAASRLSIPQCDRANPTRP